MRAGDPGWETSRRGEPEGTWRVGDAVNGGWIKSYNYSWGTGFSGFRWAIPELCGFEGYAIYLDADQLLLSDIRELWEMRPAKGFGIRICQPNRTDVMVMDCSWFKGAGWPRIATMKPSGWRTFEYLKLLRMRNATDPNMLPPEWNDCDGQIALNGGTSKLIHYTTVPDGQPWRPYPNIDYPEEFPYCKNRMIGDLWWNELTIALQETGHDEQETQRIFHELAAPR